MSEKPISPLRQRMLEDMSLRGFTPDTQRDYIRAVKKLAAFLGRSPDTATAEDLRAFPLHLTASGVQPPTINTTVTVLRFFFTVTLDRPDLARRLTVVPHPRRIPSVLSVEEVTLLLQATSGPKYKAAFATAYGAGLRVIACAKELMAAPMPAVDPPAAHDTADIDATMTDHRPTCPCCGDRMIIVEVFARGGAPRGPPSTGAGIRI